MARSYEDWCVFDVVSVLLDHFAQRHYGYYDLMGVDYSDSAITLAKRIDEDERAKVDAAYIDVDIPQAGTIECAEGDQI